MAATGLFEYSENLMEGRAQGSSRWRWLSFLALLFLGLAFYHLSIYERLTELNASWEREKQIELRLESLREENARLEAAIDDLAPEGPAIERIARQKLEMARKDETLVKIPEKR